MKGVMGDQGSLGITVFMVMLDGSQHRYVSCVRQECFSSCFLK